LDVRIGYFIFDGFRNLNRNVFVGFFIVSGAPLMSFAVVADFDQDLGVLGRGHVELGMKSVWYFVKIKVTFLYCNEDKFTTYC
jgi:hypothetical protein